MEQVLRTQKKTSSMSLNISSSATPLTDISHKEVSHREMSKREMSHGDMYSQRALSSSSVSSSVSSSLSSSVSSSLSSSVSSSLSSSVSSSPSSSKPSSVFSSKSSSVSSSKSSSVSSSKSSSVSSSSALTQGHGGLLQTGGGAPYSPQYSGSRGAPSFVKSLQDVSSLKGQLVVLEGRLRGAPPLQVLWSRDEEPIVDSDDFRILRKKASSASVPEELCTLVITEAFPEDSGRYKCVALNSYGSVSCSAVLDVYNDLEEQMEMESLRQNKSESRTRALSSRPTVPEPEPPPDPGPDQELEWPESPPEEALPTDHSFPEPEQLSRSEPDLSPEESERSEVTVREATPSPPPPPSPPEAEVKKSRLFTPSKLHFTSGSSAMNLSDLPSFSPSSFPSTGFNYERPRHFIQSQPAFKAPSYDSVLQGAELDGAGLHQDNAPSSPPLMSPPSSISNTSSEARATLQVSHSQICRSETASVSQTQSQFQSLSLNQVQSKSSSQSVISPSSVLLSPSSPQPRTLRSSLTLTPSSPSATVGLGSASLPANQDGISAPAAYLCSVLPGSKSPSRSPLLPPRLMPQASVPSQAHLPHTAGPPQVYTTGPPQAYSAGPPQAHNTGPRSQPPATLSPRSPLSPQHQNLQHLQNPQNPQHLQNPQNIGRVQPTVVSLPTSYKPTPNILPKPILKKTVAPRPSSARSTDEDIQGSKDALIQDLEKKLRSKEARRRTGQKLSYEERMARRLLGPNNATYMFDQDLSDCMDQLDFSEGRHSGGLWGRHHSGADEKTNEGSAIQEKCYAPRFLQIPPDLTVEEGRFCRIDFKVGGLPSPDVSWYLDGKAIRPDDYHKMLVCEKGLHSFIIEIVTVHHAGVYECVAHNRAGESRFSMRLDVIAQEALRPPTFVQKMLNSRALEGDTVRLECKVDASPPPQLFWKKDKDMLRIDPQRMSLYQDGSGRQCLLIERVVKSDAGWYTLSAINEAGMSTCNARLDISSRTTLPMKTVPPASKTLKLLSSLSHVPNLAADGQALGLTTKGGHVLGLASEGGHIPGLASEGGHVLGLASEGGHIPGLASEGGHVLGLASEGGHVLGLASEGGHVLGLASEGGHVLGLASEGGHVPGLASEGGHVPGLASEGGHTAPLYESEEL